jgi:hypothetical protein
VANLKCVSALSKGTSAKNARAGQQTARSTGMLRLEREMMLNSSSPIFLGCVPELPTSYSLKNIELDTWFSVGHVTLDFLI